MLMPRKVRHRKVQRGRMTGASKGGTKMAFGGVKDAGQRQAIINYLKTL